MKFLGTTKNEDIYPDVKIPEYKNIRHRKSVRIVLFDEENKIALYQYLSREGYESGEYGLPGGGVEDGESVLDAVKREILEETGCEIRELKEVGYIVEHMKKNEDTELVQEVYCFAGNVLGDKKEPQVTKREKEDLMTVAWKTLEESIEIISKQEPSFTRTRCLIFLEEIKKIIFHP